MNAAGILYVGDMGSVVARRLLAGGWQVLTVGEGRSARTRAAGAAAGVTDLVSLDDLVSRSRVLFSLVPPAAAAETARAVAGAAKRTGGRPLFVEANSVSPATVSLISDELAAAGLDCVDGAFVGSAAMLGDKTVLYASGPRAKELRSLVGDAFRVTVLGDSVGLASAFKLAFASFNKGLVALFLEVALAADRVGQRSELLEALAAFYPQTVATVERLLPTYPGHAARRSDELREAVRWQQSIGLPGDMAAAASAVLDAFAALGMSPEAEWPADAVVREWCDRRPPAEAEVAGEP
jgi:3-hydroxyisobutyrate dehydrogenase-like beta-hydroxyacid dehydrogenase